jgi:hypothetical protein
VCFLAIMMALHLERTRQILQDERISYFRDISETNLSSFDTSLQTIWLERLKNYRLKNKDAHEADYPCRFFDAHFIGYSTMRFILFVLFVTTASNWLDLLLPELVENTIKDSFEDALRTLKIWRIFYNKENGKWLSDMALYDKTLFDFGFVELIQEKLNVFSKAFPLKLNSLLNEGVMKFLRVLYRLLLLAKESTYTFLSFFKLNESKEDLDLFYENISQCTSYDNQIVQYVSLKYDSVLNCKRKIEDAEDGDYIAVKVYIQTKTEVLGFLEDRQEFIQSRIKELNGKIRKTTIELCEVNCSRPFTSGMTARRAASAFQERTNKTRELTEYLERKKMALKKFYENYTRNEEKIYIAKQYKK